MATAITKILDQLIPSLVEEPPYLRSREMREMYWRIAEYIVLVDLADRVADESLDPDQAP